MEGKALKKEVLERVKDDLRSMGLSDMEAKIYTILLKNPGLTVSDVANKLGVTRQWAHKVLRDLYKKGLVYTSNQRPIHFFAPPPEVAGLILAREKEREFYKALKIQERVNNERNE